MLDQKQYDKLLHILPQFKVADAALLRDLRQHAFIAQIPAGRDVFVVGDDVSAIALLISGSVRVYKVGDTGREITLYRFSTGQSCILTASAILNDENFSAIATVEQDAEAIMIPADTFRNWVDQHRLWRGFVFDLLSQRLANVLEIIDEVAFARLDTRLAALLLERTLPEDTLHITHQEIADELGSSREVISRVLSNFARQGLLRSSRGAITILDANRLREIS